MKRTFRLTCTHLILALMLTACGPQPSDTLSPATPLSPGPTAALLSTPPPGSTAPATSTPPASAHATLTEVQGTVEARDPARAEFERAQEGWKVTQGGQVRTAEDGRTRLDLSDGTFLRLGPSTLFTLTGSEPAQSKVDLLLGQIWIVLTGGELQVRTPSGMASVRGSYMSVAYNPATARTRVTCLEGSCLVQSFTQGCELSTGQAAELLGPEEAQQEEIDILVEAIPQEELEQWLEFMPEAEEIMPLVEQTLQGEMQMPEVFDLPPDMMTPIPESVLLPYMSCLNDQSCLTYCSATPKPADCINFEAQLAAQGVNLDMFWICYSAIFDAQTCANTCTPSNFPMEEPTPEAPPEWETPTPEPVFVPYISCLGDQSCMTYCSATPKPEDCINFEAQLAAQGVNLEMFWTCYSAIFDAQNCANTFR